MKNNAFGGRIGRKGYILAGLAVLASFAVVTLIYMYSPESPITNLLFPIFIMFAALVGVSLRVRRFHDLGNSGWLVLLWVIPFPISVILEFYLLFFKGKETSNKYGPATRYTTLWSAIIGS